MLIAVIFFQLLEVYPGIYEVHRAAEVIEGRGKEERKWGGKRKGRRKNGGEGGGWRKEGTERKAFQGKNNFNKV